MAHRFGLAESFDVAGRGTVRVPTLVMAGDRDLLVPPESLQHLARVLPSGKCVRLAGSGHLAFVTHPQCIADEVGGFLRDVGYVQAATAG
jgi:pimeloyl-ACP methyl ester carboxylesterase